jgi:hydrogenase maturation factor
MGVIASGALLLTLSPEETSALLERFAREGIEATPIGKITTRENGIRAKDARGERDLPYFERDEIAKIFGN